jgi:hypothetical protein
MFLYAQYVATAILFAGTNKRTLLKQDILSLAERINRGLDATPEDDAQMLTLFEKLEKLNPIKKPLKSPLVNKVWDLRYTTSASILGKGGAPKVGPILQKIDAPNGEAVNSEVVQYLNVFQVPQKVTAKITPVSDSKVDVKFLQFTLGPISFTAPDSFVGELDVTYLDDDLRLSRGDKGNIFVLTKYSEL